MPKKRSFVKKCISFTALVALITIAVIAIKEWLKVPEPDPDPEKAEELVVNKGVFENRHRNQGAKQIPMFILKHLHSKYSGRPLREEMVHFGFLVEPVTKNNPHGLPIGLGEAQHGKHLISSMNCASCHTGRIRVDGQLYNVEGGGNLTSSGEWANLVNDSVDELKNPIKLLGFMIRVMKDDDLPEKYTPKNTTVADVEVIKAQIGKEPSFDPVSSSDGTLSPGFIEMVEDESRELAKSQALAEMLKKVADGESYSEEVYQKLYLQELRKKKKALEDFYYKEDDSDKVDFFKDELDGAATYHKSSSALVLCQNSEKPLTKDKWVNTTRSSSSILELLLAQKKYADRAIPVIEKIGGIGPGRDDAWFVLANLIGENSEDVMNRFEPAPTKIPNLFSYSYYSRSKKYADTGEYRFHYDGNTNSLMQRNFLQAMAVGALKSKNNAGGYVTEAKIEEIHNADLYYQQIKIPNFSKIFPKHFNPTYAKEGASIYAANCASCHDRPEGKMVPIDEVNTDRKRWRFFNGRENNARRGFVLGATVNQANSILLRSAAEDNLPIDLLSVINWERNNAEWSNDRTGYMARPLNGVWASPPYLHNGSVRTIRQLLTEPHLRETSFYVGTRDYDTKNLGYHNYGNDKNKDVKHYENGELTTYRIPVAGVNGGHAYGTKLDDIEKEYLIEYLKTLGDPEDK